MSAEKYKGVFDAHPEAEEIFVGKDKNGLEQPFLNRSHALNFAGGDAGKVVAVKRPTEKKDTEPKAKKAAEGAE